jgi:hypothetical protein
MAKTTKSRLPGVETAEIWIGIPGHRGDSNFSKARITLKSGGEYPTALVSIEFQANRLDPSDLDRYYSPDPEHSADPEWDFGPSAYGPFYAGHCESHDNLRANISHSDGGACGLQRIAKTLQKVAHAAEEYNVLKAFPGCEVRQWIETLRKLGVHVPVRVTINGSDLADIRHAETTPKSWRYPARTLANTERERRAAIVKPIAAVCPLCGDDLVDLVYHLNYSHSEEMSARRANPSDPVIAELKAQGV